MAAKSFGTEESVCQFWSYDHEMNAEVSSEFPSLIAEPGGAIALSVCAISSQASSTSTKRVGTG